MACYLGAPFASTVDMTSCGTILRLLILLSAGLLFADERKWSWSFDEDKPGEKPNGFYFAETEDARPARWEVKVDQGEHVLAQLDRTRDRERYALAVVDDLSIKDVKVAVRMKAVDGDLDQAGGVTWRYRNSENYLVARLDISERNVRLYRFVNGNRVQFGVKEDLDVQKGAWYKLRVEHDGSEVKVYLDDDILFIERTPHFRRSGKIGLWAKSDSVMYFDDFQAADLDDRDDDDDDDDDD
jgi:hypothetical protein